MTAVDEEQANVSAETETTDGYWSDGTDPVPNEVRFGSTLGDKWAAYAESHPNSKRARALRNLRALEQRAIEVPILGKLHAPDKHDVVYVTGLVVLLAFGAVELPIALVVLGGHVLVKQHQSRSLSAIGEVMEDVFGH